MNAHMHLRSVLSVVAALLLSNVAHAQLFRAYLSSTGNDANPCSLPQPCRLLPAALNAVADGGEIWMLDSANYNTATVMVGKSVSILAVPGAVGSVVATAGPAISITAGGLTVALRNLVIVPLVGGGGTDGIYMDAASTLYVENSLIANLPSIGIDLVGGVVKVANTILRNNGSYAMRLQSGAFAEVTRTQMLGNGSGGVYAFGSGTPTIASVSDSVISGGEIGVSAFVVAPGSTSEVFLSRSTVSGTAYALQSQAPYGVGTAVVTASGNTVTNNNYGWYQNGTGSVISTAGNNHITNNINAPVGSLTAVLLQ